MAEFQYRVVTQAGKEKKGTVEAKSIEIASALLKAEKNIIISIEEATLLNKELNFSFGKKKVKPRDFSIFCRQFVSIIGAGVSVISALEMMGEQTENKTLKEGVIGLHEDVSKGESLTNAMKKRSKVFPSMLCNMVSAGEASGSLEIAFERMAIQFEKEAKLKGSVKKAMIYPVALLAVMAGIIVIMMVFVIPSFMGMFANLNTELPFATKMVLAMSDFFVDWWWLVLIAIVLLVAGIKYYAKTPSGKVVIGSLSLKIPVFGKLQMKTACARLGRTLCTLLGAGVPVIEALEITAKSMDNVMYRMALMTAKDQVSRGVALSKTLKSSGLFPPMVVHMISIGEETGNIEDMLENIANYYEEDVKIATEAMLALMEPLIIIVMALVVGFLILTVMSPMLSLYDSIG